MSDARRKQVATTVGRFRYPSTQPFGDNDLDRRAFAGRETEYQELSQRIMSTRMLVLYGRSGLGKTSLLQAAIYPELRRQNLLPLPVRLNHPDKGLIEIFRSAIADACEAQGVDYTPGEGPGLWEFLKTAVFWKDGELQTPVLVLDQFEELFTLHTPESRAEVVQQLGELMAPGLPPRVRARRDAGESLPFSDKPPLLKIILSLRESYLGELEALTTELPQVLSDRFRLTALDRDSARRAITEPAVLDSALGYSTPSFSFGTDVLQMMLDFLSGNTGVVEPFALQLLCSHVERKIVSRRGGTDIEISVQDLGGRSGMERVLGAFYNDVIAGIRSERQRKRARRLCTEGLLSPDGRRLSIEEALILRQYKLNQVTLDCLVNERLLRKEPRLGSFYYELSHDRLTAPILKTRKWRMPKAIRYAFAALVSLAIVMTLTAIAVNQQKARTAEVNARTARMISTLVFDLTHSLREINQVELLEAPLATAREFYEARDDKLTVEEENAYAAILSTQADIWLIKGNFDRIDDAINAYESSIEIYRRLSAAYPGEAYLKRNLAITLGRLVSHRGGYKPPEAVYSEAVEALALWREIQSLDPAEANTREFLYALEALAEIEVSLGNIAEAKMHFKELHEIVLDVVSSDPNNLDMRDLLGWSHIHIGDLYQQTGRLDQALQEYQAASNQFNGLISLELDNEKFWLGFGAALERIGNVFAARMELEDSLAAYELMRRVFLFLVENSPNNVYWRRNAFVADFRIGENHMASLDQLSALRSYQAVVAAGADGVYTQGLIPDSVQDRPALVRQIATAESAFEGAMSSAIALADLRGHHLESTQDLIATYSVLGVIYEAQGEQERAGRYYRNATALADQLKAEGRQDLTSLRMLYETRVNRGRYLVRLGRHDEAGDDFLSACRYARQGYDAAKDSRWQGYIATCTDGLGDAGLARGDLEGARRAYREALKIRVALSDASPDHAVRKMELAVSLFKASAVESSTAQREKLQREAKRILEILEQEGRLSVFGLVVYQQISASG